MMMKIAAEIQEQKNPIRILGLVKSTFTFHVTSLLPNFSSNTPIAPRKFERRTTMIGMSGFMMLPLFRYNQ